MEFAPIALFVYKRPGETRRVLEALRANEGADKSELFVFSDGPKNAGEKESTEAVRALFGSLSGFARVTVRTSETNKGLARSVIEGVSEVLRDHDRVIVLEDDLITSKYFLRFMNEALEKYRGDDRICCIHGFAYPTKYPDIPYFLRRGADCWGWATWRRGWKLFRPDARRLHDEIAGKKLQREFDRNGAFPYTKMLKDQADGRIDSWAVRWYASAFLAGKYTLQSNRMLVENIGFGEAATHRGARAKYGICLDPAPVPLESEPVFETPALAEEYRRFMALEEVTFPKRLLLKLKMIFSGRSGEKSAAGNPRGGALARLLRKYAFSPGIPAVFLNPFYFTRRELYRNMKELGANLSGTILDVGCGTQPYRHLLPCGEYRGMEFDTPENRKNKKADYFYDGTRFPLPDGSFDSVLCTEVLEHVFTPEIFVREIARILKPGGKLLLTVPFVWAEHEPPYDCARYSSFGLKFLLEKNGFEIIEHRKTCCGATVLFQLLNDCIYRKIAGRGGILRLSAAHFFTAIINVNGLFFGLFLPRNDDLYLDNIIYAVRKDPPGDA